MNLTKLKQEDKVQKNSEQTTSSKGLYDQLRTTIQQSAEVQVSKFQQTASNPGLFPSNAGTIVTSDSITFKSFTLPEYFYEPEAIPAPSQFITSHGLMIHRESLKNMTDESILALEPARDFGESTDDYNDRKMAMHDYFFDQRDNMRIGDGVDEVMNILDEPFQDEGGLLEKSREAPKINWETVKNASPFETLDALRKPRRTGRPAINDGDGNDVPASLMPEKKVIKKTTRKTLGEEVKPPFVDGGYYLDGALFSRNLTNSEYGVFCKAGYQTVLKMFPELKYIEKEKPINEDEECIILLSELADFLAMEECSLIKDFNLKTHGSDYQTAYKKYLKNISSFKRNKDG